MTSASLRAKSLAAQVPAGRPASVAEIAAAIAYLADDGASSFVQGAVLPVDGGRTAVRPHLSPGPVAAAGISRWTAARTR
ncbi:SDR family oxidoreductase [Streptomyces sp. NPDC052107]|uniref:SDR family oxidoreductase n=1 Tax=Streptomyces sp. NPDC052107 TaxID=3155632 RepID=UPI003436DD38